MVESIEPYLANAMPSSKIRLILSSECPGVGMTWPSRTRNDRSARPSGNMQVFWAD